MLTNSNTVAAAISRLALGVVLLPHGAQHLLGLFGGSGFQRTVAWMTTSAGIPAPLAALSIVVEFIAPIALILGAGSRLAGALLAVFMAVAASTHAANGFFMNWFGAHPAGTEGFEYHLLAIAMAVTVALQGGGPLSIDALIATRARRLSADVRKYEPGR